MVSSRHGEGPIDRLLLTQLRGNDNVVLAAYWPRPRATALSGTGSGSSFSQLYTSGGADWLQTVWTRQSPSLSRPVLPSNPIPIAIVQILDSDLVVYR